MISLVENLSLIELILCWWVLRQKRNNLELWNAENLKSFRNSLEFILEVTLKTTRASWSQRQLVKILDRKIREACILVDLAMMHENSMLIFGVLHGGVDYGHQ